MKHTDYNMIIAGAIACLLMVVGGILHCIHTELVKERQARESAEFEASRQANLQSIRDDVSRGMQAVEEYNELERRVYGIR